MLTFALAEFVFAGGFVVLFGRRQFYLRGRSGNFFRIVDFKGNKFDGQELFQNRLKLGNVNRLAQVIVKTFAQIDFAHAGNRACSQHDDGGFVAQNIFAAQDFKRLNAVHAGHHVIQKDYVIKIFLRHFDTLLPAVGKVGENFIAL